MDLIYDAENVSIYHGLKLVTIHQRDDTPYTYTQKEAYGLPGHHGSYEKDLEEIYQRAGEIDNILRLYLKDVAEQAEYPPKAFRSCRGIMSLEKKYGLDRLVAACACATEGRLYGYNEIRGILERGDDAAFLSPDFVREGKNLFITGSAGVGKSYIITATGIHACKNGYRTLYSNMSRLLGSFKVAKTKGNLEAELKKIERCQLLILDDAFLVPLDVKERGILLDIIEDRHERKSIILSSQLPVSSWYDAIGDPTVADAVLDRIVHTAHQIELTGESVRKIKAAKAGK